MRSPAEGMVTARSEATSGRRPMITNSVVPMAKVARVSASIAMGMIFRSGRHHQESNDGRRQAPSCLSPLVDGALSHDMDVKFTTTLSASDLAGLDERGLARDRLTKPIS